MSDLSTLFGMALFDDLPEARREWLRANLVEHHLKKGDILLREGQRVTHQFILLDGELITEKTIGGRQVFDDRRPAPASIAETSLLSEMPLPLTFIAATDCYLAALPEPVVRALLNDCGSFRRNIFRSMYSRISAYDTFILNGEKLAALGRLSAGLAHELNNPAAAVARAADGMRESLAHLRKATPALVLSAIPAEVVGKLDDWANRAAPAVDATPRAALRQSEAESLLADWLAAQGLEKPWLIAPQLSTAGFSPADLEHVAASATSEQFGALVGWLAAVLELRSLANQAWIGAGRISEIVKAMKDYSYMDQAPLQEVDIHCGIEDTLTIMRHKLKQGVTVKRDYDRTLPHVPVYGSELNQVWTNLIDNAVDAMEGSGELTIRSRRDGNFAVVEIVDTGAGIPSHILPRLFEPFFTTKPPGRGSGLGLHIAYRTVVQRHNGLISVGSDDGETIFKICLPLSQTL
ncbi:ATP-binding protein [Paraburkholderia phymatum]|uniref:histidine kinase n=1 Tax=Paraburkholderia phymatum (strain DSM 17167 / CIP 108236 / LMG 21445 / STM815) TaxID=391038 RepID=B2JQZ7_PARP8|nr:ATP-binding protein [Paraburkholderia phymatum]ACC73688.1 cyclic nucleotide-binding protein [Paraburkholderia phymatum STM815]